MVLITHTYSSIPYRDAVLSTALHPCHPLHLATRRSGTRLQPLAQRFGTWTGTWAERGSGTEIWNRDPEERSRTGNWNKGFDRYAAVREEEENKD